MDIKLNSKITNHWLWDDPLKFQWWILILFETHSEKKEVKLGNNIIKLQNNYAANSIRTWANLFKCGTKAVTNFFEILEEHDLITREILGSGKYSITLIKVNKPKKLTQ